MALIKSVRGFNPKWGKDCYFAENATLIGDLIIGNECSVWFNAVLRGDVNSLHIGDRVNLQDGCVLHTLYQKSTVTIGNDVTVGHNAIIHGADVDDGALIGMGAILLDHAHIGKGAIIAAGSVVLSNTIVEPYTLWAGVPAKFVKNVNPEQTEELNKKIASQYPFYASWYEEGHTDSTDSEK
ncbi:acetyltransferase [Bacteroides coprosuis DSM 18011]|uniref:Acetyltransferase n=1 Tax=Bacteroides coprosuis DSM 18011 TaxID=679937 RepID=F3ZRJ8_9BACE|nr:MULTISPECIES: gamma carbonic anhydrase family protein [Bacteroides]EGJ70723.1 acetyltransferase [Bacteroides coprosuis DSM 18011]HJD91630.1 gamma carbonic anhydrase family protein [Bacteroides coprosuis]